MITEVKCGNCGRELVQTMEDVSAEITFSAFKFCKGCNTCATHEEHLSFCSVQCLIEFVAKDGSKGVFDAVKRLQSRKSMVKHK